MRSLDELRMEITKLDTELLTLLAKRLELVREVGEYKKAHALPIRDEQRERQVLEGLAQQGKTLNISQEIIGSIWKSIFREAYRIEGK